VKVGRTFGDSGTEEIVYVHKKKGLRSLSALYRPVGVACSAGFLAGGNHLRYIGEPAVRIG
jgi:hypothetical protein